MKILDDEGLEAAITLFVMAHDVDPKETDKRLSLLVKSNRDRIEALKTQPSTQTTLETRTKRSKRNTPSTYRDGPKPALPVDAPEHGYSIDGTRLPSHPAFPGLRDMIIGRIAKPFEKQLTPSDVNGGQGRLALLKSFVETNYLPMLREDEDPDAGVPVTVYGPDGIGHDMDFKLWSKKTYVIYSGWKAFVDGYGLKSCTYWMTVWMFRLRDDTGGLCFALDWKVVPHTTAVIRRVTKNS